MSMTYYAVTDDPNELAHWGILGMKWGVRRTPEQLGHPRHTGSKRPRSAAYKKAQSKLGRMMKSGIKKAEAHWKEYNSPAAKYERQTNRAIQKARKGKLKYKNLTDDQVRRVTERLSLEQQARRIGDTEQTFRHRLAKSIGEGFVSGVGQGFGKVTSEFISRGSVLKTDRKRAEQQDRIETEKERRRIRNAEKQADKKAKRDLKYHKFEKEYDFEQEQRKDRYEHERDSRYEEERARNLYEYGAAYDKDGKLDYTNRSALEGYYNNRYIVGESKSQATARQQKEADRNRRLEEARQNRDRARQQREYAASVKRQEAERAAEQARLDAAEKERQRRARQQWADEIDRRNRAAAQQQAIRDYQTRQWISGRGNNPINSLPPTSNIPDYTPHPYKPPATNRRRRRSGRG